MENQFNPPHQEPRNEPKRSRRSFKSNTNAKSKVGEYVDYEEIE